MWREILRKCCVGEQIISIFIVPLSVFEKTLVRFFRVDLENDTVLHALLNLTIDARKFFNNN